MAEAWRSSVQFEHEAYVRALPRRLQAPGLERFIEAVRSRAAVAAIITAAALTAGGCGVSSSPTANFRIPNITSQDLMRELEQPTSRGPGGYEMLAGSQHLSLRGIQYTIQGTDALRSWLNIPPSKKATYQQAGRNLAVAFPADKGEIEGKLK
jgi:hypothetical protein